MKSKFCLFLTLSSFALLAASSLQAGEDRMLVNPAGSLSLREALRLTLLQNPELAAARSSITAAEGRRLQAGLRPNPTLFTEADNLIGSGAYRGARQSENTLQLSQLVELGGKRTTRLRVADAGRDLAGFDYESKRLEVLVTTTKAFVQTLSAQRRRQLADEASILAEDLIPAIQRRVEAGAANAVEVTRAQNAVATARIEAQQAARELSSARQRLAAQWGATTPRFASAAGDLERIVPTPPLDTLVKQLGLNPAVARFSTELAQRRAEVARARADAVPDVTVAAGPRYLPESNDATVRLNVSVPLPLFNRNQGAIRETQAELERTGFSQRATANQLAVALGDAFRTLTAARQEIETLRGTLLPGSENAARQIDEGYGAGRYSLLDVLDSRRTLAGARLQLLNAQVACHQALADLDGLTGQVRQAPSTAQPPHRTANPSSNHKK